MNFLKKLFWKKEEVKQEIEEVSNLDKRDYQNIATQHPEVVEYLEREYPVALKTSTEHAETIYELYKVDVSPAYVRNYARLHGLKRPNSLATKITKHANDKSKILVKENVSEEFIALIVRGYPSTTLTSAKFLAECNKTLGTNYGHHVLNAIVREHKLKKLKGESETVRILRKKYNVNQQCAYFIERDYPTSVSLREDYIAKLNNTWGATFTYSGFNNYLHVAGIKKDKKTLEKVRYEIQQREETTKPTRSDKISWTEHDDLKNFIIKNTNFRDNQDIDNTRTLVKVNYNLNLSRKQIFSIISWSNKVILWLEDNNKTRMTAPLCAKFLDYIEKHPEVIYRSACGSGHPYIYEAMYHQINSDLGFHMTRNTYNVVTRMLYRANILKWIEKDKKYIVVRTNKVEDNKVDDNKMDVVQKPPRTRANSMSSILLKYKDFIQEDYPNTQLTPKEYVNFLNNKFNINVTHFAFATFVSRHNIKRKNKKLIRKTRGYMTEYTVLPKDVSREVLSKLINRIDVSHSTIRVASAALTWVQHGGIMTPDTTFIHWDDNPCNNSIENIIGVPKFEFSAYTNKRSYLNVPKGNAELNKSIYQQVLLEREIKKEKI